MCGWKNSLSNAIDQSINPLVSRPGLAAQRPAKTEITQILDGLKQARGDEIPVERLYPAGIPTNEEFFEILFRLKLALGFGDAEGEIAALVASAAVGKLSEEDRSLILLGIADQSPKNLSFRLEIFPQILRDHPWPLSLVSKILLSADDKQFQGNSGYDRAIQALAESRQELAYDLVHEFLRNAPTEKSLRLAHHLLGLTRLHAASGELRLKIERLDTELRNSVQIQHRIVYLRSLVPTAWPRGLNAETLKHLQSVYQSGEAEERIIAFELLGHLAWCPANQEEIFLELVGWFEEVTHPGLPDRCKTAIVVLIHNMAFWGKGYLADNLERISDLWLKILPVDSGNTNYWNGIDLALHDLIEKNPIAFEKIFSRLAEVDGKRLVDAITESGGQQNRMLLYSLRQTPNARLVQNLLLSLHHSARTVGIYLYDELGYPIIEKNSLDATEEKRLLLLLLEIRLHHVSGLAQARLFVSLLGQADRCSPDFRQELLSDLTLLGKDLPGTVLEFFKGITEPSPLLVEALVQIDAYFDNLRSSDKCPALYMSIPGYSRAVALFGKRFSRQVTAAAERHSVFFMLTSRITLLYALHHSTYQNGVLSPAQALQNISTSTESPRIGVIAPENQAFRRLMAKQWIAEIESEASHD